MTEEIREREKTSAEDLDEREVPIFSGMENEPPEQTVKELQQMLENQKIGFMKFVFKIIGDTREREKLLREMNEKIEWLKASVMITDEQEECCMKEGDLLCDTGETSAAEWARREAAERGKEPLEQKVKLLQQKLDKEEIAFEEFRVKMTEEIRECDDLLRKVDQSIKELEASVMITDEQEECCMKKSELLCDAGKTSAGAEEWTRRVAAEKVMECLEQKYTEFWQKLEDQERVHEGLIAIMTQEIIEREKSSAAEWARREAAERGKEPLEEKIKELQQMLEDQERVSEGFRAQVPEEMKEREKTSAAEWARREAAERGKEPLEEKIKELQQMLEDQERVSEGFRPQIPEEMKEREKTSAEDLDKKEVEREMELLKQKIKELQQMLEDQESVSEGFRPQIPEEMKEREKTSAEEPNKREEAEREEESLEQNVKGLQQKLEDRQTDVNGLKAQVTEGISKREKTSADLPGTAEWDLSEAAEGEKVDLEQKVRELQQMLEDQERAFEFYRVIITEEIQGIDDLLRKISESTELLEATINNENDRIMSKMLKMTARPR
ncbi:golgin subfamily A member 6-like protein 6 isoform X11 [Camelus ferus]|uniref:Golgin subfamily A member 6-like protein 6 isoform X11 n=1 Tax=Camelus ferus TaxID=419612 RepID=A0A8B8TKZ5_CAMFR|nr:golgin subfamily A member 6-like protein 6 isoform X11 [Camelus ferus]